MGKTLGETLKEARGLIRLTLRQVEEAICVSNAYLSQLENDKIKHPSANVLYKLASIYKIDLDVLLIASGIIKEDQNIRKLKIKGAYVLTPEEERQLLEYLKFLRAK